MEKFKKSNSIIDSQSSEPSWITVHPNGAGTKGVPVPVKAGQDKGEAIKQHFNKAAQKDDTGPSREKNKFEHLMTEENKTELYKNGTTRITSNGGVTINKMVTVRAPYSAAKNVLSDMVYCFNRRITKGNYDAETKTIELTGLFPLSRNNNLVKAGVEILKESYTYGM